MTRHTSGRTHHWLTQDGHPDETGTRWPEGTLTALRERLKLGY
ncbi:hypothetical protein ABT278_16480 [Streptomyces sp. NPDC001228]